MSMEVFPAADRNWVGENCIAVHVPEPVWDRGDALPRLATAARAKRPVSLLTPQASPEHKIPAR